MTLVTGQTRLLAVIGNPVRHSLSPQMQNAWLQSAGIDAVYFALEATEPSFEGLVSGLALAGAVGVNVTVPFKERALSLADTAGETARRSGAANTLIFQDGRIHAENTDGVGLVGDLDTRAPGWRDVDGPVVLLGAGGAARGIAAALVETGCTDMRIVARRPEQADALAVSMGTGSAWAWTQLQSAMAGAALVINATPLGLGGDNPLEPDLAELSAGATVYDTVYKPRETALLVRARAYGLRGLDGLGMLAGQGARAFGLWFDTEPSVESGLATLEDVLAARDAP